jgi:hypothetical protein
MAAGPGPEYTGTPWERIKWAWRVLQGGSLAYRIMIEGGTIFAASPGTELAQCHFTGTKFIASDYYGDLFNS